MFFAHHCERKRLGIYMRWSCWTLESENTINTIVRDPLGYNWRRMLVNLFTTINVFAKLPRNIQVHMLSYKFLRLFRRIYVWILFLNYPASVKLWIPAELPYILIKVDAEGKNYKTRRGYHSELQCLASIDFYQKLTLSSRWELYLVPSLDSRSSPLQVNGTDMDCLADVLMHHACS